MRLSRADFRSACKSFFRLEFASQDITAFGGLELIRRYFGLIKLHRRVRRCLPDTIWEETIGAIDMILVIIGLILVGGRRLDHLNYLCDDPLVKRFCGLLRLPRERSVGRWLKRFTQKSLAALVEINSQIVCEAMEKENLGRLTLDIDGSVITTGASVGWAFRGFNPHHRKEPSYYPILAHLAQTGHILRVKIGRATSMTPKARWAFARIDRGPENAVGELSAFGVSYGRGLFPARDYRAVGEKKSGLCRQSSVFQVAGITAFDSRTPALARAE